MIKRRKRERFGTRQETRIRCPAHLAWVRGFSCPVCDERQVFQLARTQAAHVRSGTDGGLSVKPGDNWAIPLCAIHHAEQHMDGENAFAARYGIDMKALAAQLWQRSPHRIKYEQRIRERKERTA